MNEYLIQKGTLTNIANAIRAITGTEEELSPSKIASSVEESGTEIETQAELIEQIRVALVGKAKRGDIDVSINK